MKLNFLLFSLLFFSACEQGSYTKVIWEQEVIPSTCSAWTDGCDVYCRIPDVDIQTEKIIIPWTGGKNYQEFPIDQKCEEKDKIRARCIDTDQEKIRLCQRKACTDLVIEDPNKLFCALAIY